MNKMKTGNVLLILALMFWSQQIWALGCTLRNGLTTKNINLQSIVVQRDTPIGTVLATVPVPSSGTTLGDCQAGGYSYGGILPYASTAVGNNVYQTATPGIGIRVSQMYAANGSFVPSSASFNGPVSFADQPVTVEVIKTGNMQSGQMNSGVVAQYRWTGTSPGWITAMQIQFAAPVRVTVLSCSVNTPNLAVPMGDFLNTDFPNIGATSPAVPVNINLNCSANANVWVSVNATADPSGTTGAISLTGAGNTNFAGGIAVQMLDANKNPLGLNNKFRYANAVAGGALTIPWSARYLRTGTVKVDAANATATVSITYE